MSFVLVLEFEIEVPKHGFSSLVLSMFGLLCVSCKGLWDCFSGYLNS